MMTKKKAQSLLDFINVLPFQAIQIIPRSPITNKEAKALFSIWNSEKDPSGYQTVPEDVDPMVVAALTTKGMVNNKPLSRIGESGNPVRTVEITGKGKTIIRNIILHAEKSSFENNDFDFNYEFIHRASDNSQGKIASVVNQTCANWVQRAFRHGITPESDK
jgi:hypothetical protein